MSLFDIVSSAKAMASLIPTPISTLSRLSNSPILDGTSERALSLMCEYLVRVEPCIANNLTFPTLLRT